MARALAMYILFAVREEVGYRDVIMGEQWECTLRLYVSESRLRLP